MAILPTRLLVDNEANFFSFPYILDKIKVIFDQNFVDNLEIKKINEIVLIPFILNIIQYGKCISDVETKIPKNIIPIQYFVYMIFKLNKINSKKIDILEESEDLKKENIRNDSVMIDKNFINTDSKNLIDKNDKYGNIIIDEDKKSNEESKK